jgi:hypothetical protein
MRYIGPAAALLLLSATLACEDTLLPLPDATPPDALEFTTAGFGASTYVFEVRGDTVVARQGGWGSPAPVDSIRHVPTAEEWRAFWDAVDEAGVRRWGVYRNEDVVDGGGYTLRIEHDGVVLESSGSNAWPDQRGREHEEVTEAYNRFRHALDVLVGRLVAQA